MRLFEIRNREWKDTDSFVGRRVRRGPHAGEHANKYGVAKRHELTIDKVDSNVGRGHLSRWTLAYDDGTEEIPQGPSSFRFIDELEERKVTKTMAGKQQKPSQKLAMDRKKKSPNQGKPPVELEKTTKCVKNLSDEIVKGEYTTGKLASQKH